MKPTFKQLRQHLNYQHVKKLLNLYNKLYSYDRRTIHRIWQRNYNELINLLYELDYKGSLKFSALRAFIKSFDEEEKEQQKREDNEFFGKLSSMKAQKKQQKKQRKTYKQSIKNAATTERELMNINYDSSTNKTENRRAYESSLNRAENKSYFKKNVKSFVQKLKRNESIEVDASNNEDLKLAFAEAIRTFKNNNLFGTEKHVYIILEDLNGVRKHLPLRLKTSTQLVERILGEVTTTQDASDSQEYINHSFIQQ